MLTIYFMCIVSGISSVWSSKHQAPGTIKMNMKYSLAMRLNTNYEFTLYSTVNTTKQNRVLYKRNDRMNLTSDDVLEVTILFDAYNISEAIDFNGIMTTRLNGKQIETNEFTLRAVEYSATKSVLLNKIRYVTATAYSKDYSKELDVMISAKCKRNYYPEFDCSVLCIITKNIDRCDSNGKTICRQGFYFNDHSLKCETDWCIKSKPVCLNGGRCVNRINESECNCGPMYTGKFCQTPLDSCHQYKCPNKTYCSVKFNHVSCITVDQKKSIASHGNNYFKVMSIYSIMSMFGFVFVFIITILLTIWACRTPKFERYRSMDASIHSSHTYYPNNSLSKVSKYCLQCQHETIPSLNMYNSIYGNRAFYSLRSHSRNPNSLNRAFSDIIIPYDDRHLSMKSVSIPDESLPLPPPIENL